MQLKAMSGEVCPPCHRSLSVASLPCIEPCRITKNNKLTPSNRFEITKSHRCFLLSCSTFTILHHLSPSFTIFHLPCHSTSSYMILHCTWTMLRHRCGGCGMLWIPCVSWKGGLMDTLCQWFHAELPRAFLARHCLQQPYVLMHTILTVIYVCRIIYK